MMFSDLSGASAGLILNQFLLVEPYYNHDKNGSRL